MTVYLNSYRCHACAYPWQIEADAQHDDRCPECDATNEPFESLERNSMTTIQQKIQGVIDAAQASGMALSDADHGREIDSRLDMLAAEFMAARRFLTPMSLDEWLAENHDLLTQDERDDGNAILAAYFK